MPDDHGIATHIRPPSWRILPAGFIRTTGANDVRVAPSNSTIGDAVRFSNRSGVCAHAHLWPRVSRSKGPSANRHWYWRDWRCSARRFVQKKPAKRTIPTKPWRSGKQFHEKIHQSQKSEAEERRLENRKRLAAQGQAARACRQRAADRTTDSRPTANTGQFWAIIIAAASRFKVVRLNGSAEDVVPAPTPSNRRALLETIFWTTPLWSRRICSPTLLSTMFLSAILCRRFALDLPR